MKVGRYRSAAQYFAIAKSRHIEAGHTWSQQLDLARAQAIRSITRGIGPAATKLHISFDNVRLDFSFALTKAYTEMEVPMSLRVKEPFATAITALWFLLRGIEVAGVKGEDVRFNRSERAVTVRLPVSKTDLEGKGCERRHVCICSLEHDSQCPFAEDRATMFAALQKCKCSSGRHPLCVFHALLELVVRRRKSGSYDPSQPLFGDGQSAVSQRQLTQLARICAFVLHQETLYEWSPTALEKWSQHCFRVSGAQLFARAGVPLPVTQVIGRWGSMSVMRYVQDAIFVPDQTAAQVRSALTSASSSASASSSSPPQMQGVSSASVESVVRRVVAECWQNKAVFVHNTRTKFAHKPCENEQALQSFDWVSACGRWHYGSSNHLRHPSVLPGFSRCAKCFAEEQAVRSAQDQQPVAPPSEESGDSESSSSKA